MGFRVEYPKEGKHSSASSHSYFHLSYIAIRTKPNGAPHCTITIIYCDNKKGFVWFKKKSQKKKSKIFMLSCGRENKEKETFYL